MTGIETLSAFLAGDLNASPATRATGGADKVVRLVGQVEALYPTPKAFA